MCVLCVCAFILFYFIFLFPPPPPLEGNIDQFNKSTIQHHTSNRPKQKKTKKQKFKIKTHTHSDKHRETHNCRPPQHHLSLPIHLPQTHTILTIQHHMIYCSNPKQIFKKKNPYPCWHALDQGRKGGGGARGAPTPPKLSNVLTNNDLKYHIWDRKSVV